MLKDYFHASAWYRRGVARWLIANEAAAYTRLQGLPGVPVLLGRPGPDGLLIQHIAGRSVRVLGYGDLPRSAVEQARELVGGLHRRGVVHGDLGHDANGDYGRDTNLLLGDDGRLYVLDFAGALLAGRFNLGLYSVLARHDRLLPTKLVRRFWPEETDHPDYFGVERLPYWTRRVLRFLKKL